MALKLFSMIALCLQTHLRPDLRVAELDEDPRIQIYRTSMDSFLTWLSLVASALDRNLFVVPDIQDVGYWVAKLQSEDAVHRSIEAYGYKKNISMLIRFYRTRRSPYRKWLFPTNIAGSGDNHNGMSETE